MIITVDSSALIMLINPAGIPPNDPLTKLPVVKGQERIEYFLSTLAPSDTILVPTPVLAEALVKAGEGAGEILGRINGEARLKVAPFDLRAAAETAVMTQEALAAGDKSSGTGQPWQKVKFDRQIIAIARVARADRILADDSGLIRFARLIGMEAKSTWELDLPPEPEPNLFTPLESQG